MTQESDRLTRALAGHYRVDREIGRGGMATVYLAHDIKHQRFVALKVLRPELAASLGAERFLREITLTARLDHPHILPLLDSGHTEELLYYVMPYVEGESLRDRLTREHQLPLDEALQIACQVADALSYAHSRGIVHRDIKPENILLSVGHARVADFGIARAVTAAGGESLTQTGLAVGTPAYMSPEQGAGDRALDTRSDIYSLGCVIYELLAGEPPFTGPTPAAVLARHSIDPVPPLRTVRSTVPEALERAITTALAKAPADRYASAAVFAAALTSPSTLEPPARSIAVLPFANLGGDPDNEYFADGITEDVIAQLSKIRALKVISRTSVMAFKKRDLSLREIARQLDVATLLEGSVRRAGNRVRVVAQLIDARNDQHLWADTYDRELTDIFAIQSDVALRIAGALEAELSPHERTLLGDRGATKRSPIPEAYEAFLRGRFHVYRHTPEGFQTALQYFEQAVQRDPAFGLAHGAIADVWGARTFVGLVAPREAYPIVRPGVLKAVELDDRAAEIQDYLGRLKCWFEWDWTGAERAFQRALELNPNYVEAHLFYAWLLTALQRPDDAQPLMDRALELDPFNPFVHWVSGFTLLLQHRYDEAATQLRKTLQMDAGFLLVRFGLWSIFHQLQDQANSMRQARGYFDALNDHEVSAALVSGFKKGGYALAMRSAGAKLADRSGRSYVPPTQVARLYAYGDDRERAVRWLVKAYEERDLHIVLLRVDPGWQSLHPDPRFQNLLSRMGFPA